ncbi:uncharacterized protein LOC111624096 [Centruroides sculpturatus]|uniref:uncharacterized protein LOC111624096 n=1 Tax=Centruroides sculpturatus TaxID=218467 RepID=UPI000C6DA6F8|nr:uncharacterized protein LOC111624096 [Centruroides sculpturatus]
MHWLKLLLKIGLIISINFYNCVLNEDSYWIRGISWVNIQNISYETDILYFFFMLRLGYVKFRLYKIPSVFSAATKVYLCTGDKIYKYHLKNLRRLFFVEGNTIFGYSYNNILTARLELDKYIYYVEPIGEYRFMGFKDTNIIYDAKNVKYKIKRQNINLICDELTNETESVDTNCDYAKPSKSKFNIHNRKRNRRSCSLELLADYTYIRKMNFDIEKTVGQMMFYAMHADYVFKNLDLDEDGIPDRIRFNVKKVTLFRDETSPESPFRKNFKYNYTTFLDHLAQYSHPYCMLICFCHRDFGSNSTYSVGKARRYMFPSNT